jgi:hypothetical protein
MSSKLATNFVEVSLPSGELGDLIWRNANIANLSNIAILPTEKLSLEFASLLENSELEKFASLVGPSTTIQAMINKFKKKPMLKGLILNKYTSDEQLAEIGKLDQSLIAQVEEALNIRKTIRQELQKENYTIFHDAEVLNELDAETITKVTNTESLIERNKFLNTLEKVDNGKYNFVMNKIVGLTDNNFTGYVDSFVARWLVSSDCLEAKTSLALVEQYPLDLSKRISKGALRIMENAKIDTSRISPKRNIVQPTNVTSKSMLDTLALAGMDLQTIMALVLSTNVELTAAEFVAYLTQSPRSMQINFLTGATSRKPKPGEVDLLIKSFQAEERAEIVTLLSESQDLEDLPWFNEMALGLPKKYLDKLNENIIYEVFSYTQNSLSDNLQAWEFLLVVSEEWENNYFSLVEASLEV